jgi:hypothetical protein
MSRLRKLLLQNEMASFWTADINLVTDEVLKQG